MSYRKRPDLNLTLIHINIVIIKHLSLINPIVLRWAETARVSLPYTGPGWAGIIFLHFVMAFYVVGTC